MTEEASERLGSQLSARFVFPLDCLWLREGSSGAIGASLECLLLCIPPVQG